MELNQVRTVKKEVLEGGLDQAGIAAYYKLTKRDLSTILNLLSILRYQAVEMDGNPKRCFLFSNDQILKLRMTTPHKNKPASKIVPGRRLIDLGKEDQPWYRQK